MPAVPEFEIEQDMAVLDAIAGMAEPEIAAPVLPSRRSRAGHVVERAIEPAIAEPVIVERAGDTIARSLCPNQNTPQPSLGATLIASGIVSRSSAAHDARRRSGA